MGLISKLKSVSMSARPKVELQERGDVSLLVLTGKFDDGADTVLAVAFQQLDKSKPRCVVLNVSRATFIGNYTVGELVAHMVRLRKQKAEIKLVADPQSSRNTDWWLRGAKLNQVFEVYQDETQAIRSFAQNNET